MADTFRAMCAELNFIWGKLTNLDDLFENMIPLINRARALLAQPEPVGLTQQGGGDEPLIGDYVLATKWSDGDPCDHFCVGFFSGKDRDRYKVVDADGNLFRANGFRRCETITQEEGELILSLKIGDQTGPSVWWHLKKIRGIGAQPEPEGLTDEELLRTYGKAKRDHCYEGDADDWPKKSERAATVAGLRAAIAADRAHHPTHQPVAVSERLPGPEDCDEQGRCFFHSVGRAWRDWYLLKVSSASETETHWLPFNALPLPQVHDLLHPSTSHPNR